MSAFRTAENRIAAKRVKKKFETPKEDVTPVRVLSDKAVSVAGTLYPADSAGFQPGEIIDAVNTGTNGNANYVAKFGSQSSTGNAGLTKAELQQIKDLIGGAFDDWVADPRSRFPPTDPPAGDPAGEMTVTPGTGISASGRVGSNFTSNSQVYTLENIGDNSFNWQAYSTRDWINVSSGSGTLAPGATTTTTVSINALASNLKQGAYTGLVIYNAGGATAATTAVTVTTTGLLNPTLDDVIRGSVGPVSGSGSSVTFTVPAWVQTGDGMVFMMASRVDYSDADYIADNTVPTGIDDEDGWTTASAYTSKAGHTLGTYYWTKILIAEMVTKAAGVGEAGTEYTFTFKHETESFHYYLLVFNKDHMLSDVIDNGDINSAYHDGDGYQDPGITDFYAPSLSLYSLAPAVITFGAIDGNERVAPQANWRELCDIGDSNVSLFIMARMMTGTTGTIQAYMDNSNEYFASIDFEAESL